MFPSPSSSTADGTLLRRMLIESSGIGPPPLKRQPDLGEFPEQALMEGRRADHSDSHLEDVPSHSRMGSYSWDSVIADAMLSMTASPLVHHMQRRHGAPVGLGTDSDTEAARELSLSPHELEADNDDDDEDDDDDQNDMLGLNMDQDSSGSCLNESSSSAVTGLADHSGSSGSSEHLSSLHIPRKKGRPSKFGLGTSGLHSGVECPVCRKVFNNSSALAKHKLTHSTERKYACRICAKTFKRQDHLNGHMLTHSSKKPFECRYPSCGRSYCDARSLRRHHDNYHARPASVGLSTSQEGLAGASLAAASSDPLSFGTVGLSSSAGILHGHDLGSSTGGQPVSSTSYDDELRHECELCGRRFKNLPALNGHMRLHGGYFKKDTITGDASRVASKLSEPKHSKSSSPAVEASFIQNSQQSAGAEFDNQWIGANVLLPASHMSSADTSSSSAAAPASVSSSMNLTGSVLPLNVTPNDLSGLIRLAREASAAGSGVRVIPSPGTGVRVIPSQFGLLLPRNVLVSADESGVNVLGNFGQVQSDSDVVPGEVNVRSGEYGLQNFEINPSDYVKHRVSSTAEIMEWQGTDDANMDVSTKIAQTANDDPRTDRHKDSSVDSGKLPHSKATAQTTGSHSSSVRNFPAIHQLLQRGVVSAEHDPSSVVSEAAVLTVDTGRHEADSTDSQPLGRRRWISADPDMLKRPRRWDIVEDESHELWRQESAGFEMNSIKSEEAYQPLLMMMPYEQFGGNPLGTEANGDDEETNKQLTHPEFSAPAGMGLHHKFRRKNRPEPLVIPSPVTHFGFQSRLRSPRICDNPGPMISSIVTTQPSSFTPYTPPPMLSPLRIGSGLFCSLVEPSPKSAPVGFRLGLMRCNSLSSSSATAQQATAILEEEEEEESENIMEFPPVETEEVIHEADLEPPPQTDILPHINVGTDYQADIPPFNADRKGAFEVPNKEELVWDPSVMKMVSEEDVRHFMDFACCAAIPGSGANKEYAHHVLNMCRGNIKLAALRLMQREPRLEAGHTLHNYVYQETNVWNAEEIEIYQQAMMKYDKDFFRVSLEVRTKNVRECTEFYFLWKKVCVEEWRRMRILRRKRLQESLYHLRSTEQSKAGGAAASDTSVLQAHVSSQKCAFNIIDDLGELSGTEGLNSQPGSPRQLPQAPPPPPVERRPPPVEQFPCRICGKVFDRVKSRSAHMKSHRQLDSDSHHRSTLPFSDIVR